MAILITGAAGFIGAQLSKYLLKCGEPVVGIDNLNNYMDRTSLSALFTQEKFRQVVNLAAQAGVRYSLDNPYAYVDSNLVGFINLLENCRHHTVEHLVFASSSSVYGLNTKMPGSVHRI